MATAAVLVDGRGYLTGRLELLLEGVVSAAVVEGGGGEGENGEEEEDGEEGGRAFGKERLFWLLIGIFGCVKGGGGSVGRSGGCIGIGSGRSGRGIIAMIITRSAPVIHRAVDSIDIGSVSLRRRLQLRLRPG